MLRPSQFGCPPFSSPHRRWSHAGARHVVNALAASSELRRQTSGCFSKSDSARLTVCTGALCDRQPASATLPCPMTCSLATNHAVLSGSMFAWAAGPSRCRTLGCGGISSGPCHCEQVCHPRHPFLPHPQEPKTLCKPAAFVSRLAKKQSI